MMEHRAFIFDTEKFKHELLTIILKSGLEDEDTQLLDSFILSQIGKVSSPYTGEPLDNEWKDELENGDVQEMADFALTCYYSPQDDYGLSYSWDSLLEALKRLKPNFDPEYCILGKSIKTETFVLDPGGMGMGFVDAKDIPNILDELVKLQKVFIENGLPPTEEILYEITFTELVDAYNMLVDLYQEASNINKGLLMTF